MSRQSDGSYFFVVGWGCTTSLLALHPGLRPQAGSDRGLDQRRRAAGVEWTGLPQAPLDARARLVTDYGSGRLAEAFEDYLRALGIRHIYCAPHHPQTQGKLERFHETLKARLNLLVYTSPGRLHAAMADFIDFYNHRLRRDRLRRARQRDARGGNVTAAPLE